MEPVVPLKEGREMLKMASSVPVRAILSRVSVRSILVLVALTFWWFLFVFRVSIKNPDGQEIVSLGTHTSLTQLQGLRSSHILNSHQSEEQELQLLRTNHTLTSVQEEEQEMAEEEEQQQQEEEEEPERVLPSIHTLTFRQQEDPEMPEEEEKEEREQEQEEEERELGLRSSHNPTFRQEEEPKEPEEPEQEQEHEQGQRSSHIATSRQEEEPEKSQEEEQERGLRSSDNLTFRQEEEPKKPQEQEHTLNSLQVEEVEEPKQQEQEQEHEHKHEQGQRSSHIVTSLQEEPEKPQEQEEKPSMWSKPLIGAKRIIDPTIDPCAGRYIYMHDLPPEFNQNLIDACRSINSWTDMCQYTVNGGLGQPLVEDPLGIFLPNGTWFATEMFIVDVIFHSRMKRYKCLTKDSRQAKLVYIPFYAGLDITRYLWGSSIAQRDNLTLALTDWLLASPEWKRMGGQDHFLVGSRITWDFRSSGEDNSWGNRLLLLPALSNVSVLLVEINHWGQTHDYAIPYPTYFHPKQDSDIINWQNRVRALKRKSLFSFAGAPRPEMSSSIRGQIIEQCSQSSYCKLLDCHGSMKCHAPYNIMALFMESVFCLQPSGDSFTRRSTFDSMVAGCIPVFFHTESAYTQYTWHLPDNHSSYSVYISEDKVRDSNISIEAILLKIPKEQVQAMRKEVIRLIPSLLYAHPEHQLQNIKDAFDITIEELIKKVEDVRIVSIVKEAIDTSQEDQSLNNPIIYTPLDSSLITQPDNISKSLQDDANLVSNLSRSHRKLVN